VFAKPGCGLIKWISILHRHAGTAGTVRTLSCRYAVTCRTRRYVAASGDLPRLSGTAGDKNNLSGAELARRRFIRHDLLSECGFGKHKSQSRKRNGFNELFISCSQFKGSRRIGTADKTTSGELPWVRPHSPAVSSAALGRRTGGGCPIRRPRRHGRACPGHPRLEREKDVDARHRRQVYAVCASLTAMAGHDEGRIWSWPAGNHPSPPYLA